MRVLARLSRAPACCAHCPACQLRLTALAAEAELARARVILASAHLDPDPGNNRLRNLVARRRRCDPGA